jgi:hypothetical protein
MNEVYTYLIQLRGVVDEAEINAGSPLHTTVEPQGTAATLLTVRTDQSGLVGLLRHLHGRGFVLQAVRIAQDTERGPSPGPSPRAYD